jgi:hypothetical protein
MIVGRYSYRNLQRRSLEERRHVMERMMSLLSAQAGFQWCRLSAVWDPVNRSKTTPAVFIGARNEATAQESVVMRPDLDAKVP